MDDNNIDYADVQEFVPELKNTPYIVVIIGYHDCPHSHKSLQALAKHPEWSKEENHYFKGYNFGDTGPLKEQIGYYGSFPIVFVKDAKDGEMKHIGGGTEFVERVIKEIV